MQAEEEDELKRQPAWEEDLQKQPEEEEETLQTKEKSSLAPVVKRGQFNARAFTEGQNVVFGPGQFSSGLSTGKRLLAHNKHI